MMTRISPRTFFGPGSTRKRIILLLIILTLPLSACGLLNPQYYRNNEVRLAVYDYERTLHGPVTELIIAFERTEPRVKFEGQRENGGRTVWLYDLAAREYFTARPQEITFLFIQNIEFADDYRQAVVTLYRGRGDNYAGHQLILNKQADGAWVVTGEVLMDDSRSGSGQSQN